VRLPSWVVIESLQVGRQALPGGGIGQHRLCLGTEQVAVPRTEQAHQQGQVGLRRGLGEMRIDGLGAAPQPAP
jgi:hypothetical protein